MLFVIITVLSFLIAYKLSNYIADFKTIKHQSRIDIIFLTIFFIILFIPISHINQESKSLSENRYLAKWKPLINKNEINYNFGKDYENWFNDRFYLRNKLIGLNYNFQYYTRPVIESPNAVYIKKGNWFFNKSKFGTLQKKKFEHVISNIDKLNDYCNKHNIKLYVLIVPDKELIYTDIAEPYLNNKRKLKYNKQIFEFEQKTKANTKYVYNEMSEGAKKDYVGFKSEHHWTDYGAFIGYQELMKMIRKDFPQIKEAQESDFNISFSKEVQADFFPYFGVGQTVQRISPSFSNFSNKFLDTDYKYYTHKNNKLLKSTYINTDKNFGKDFYYPDGANLRVLEIGTSMNENLLKFTPYSFRSVKYIRLNNVKNIPDDEGFKIFKYYKEKIETYNPDIIILCITAYNMRYLDKLFNED